jgi:rhamnosyltransferase
VSWGGYKIAKPSPNESWTRCDQLIASGCLIPAEVLLSVGVMNEHLFIDKVDTEWCLRAKSRGFTLLGVPTAHLNHRLGEGQARLWFIRWRALPLHSPPRYYFMFRNAFLLTRMPHAPVRWRMAEVKYLVKLLAAIFVLRIGGRPTRKAVLNGIRDGMRGASGPGRFSARP